MTSFSLLINENLDSDAVLQEILNSACSRTDARYGMIATLDDSGQVEGFLKGLRPMSGSLLKVLRQIPTL